MSTASTQIDIVHSGNKFDLLAQLGDIGRIELRPTFKLKLRVFSDDGDEEVSDIGVFINGVHALDGSGDSWHITGRLAVYDFHKMYKSRWLIIRLIGLNNNVGRFEGELNTKTRKGLIKPKQQ